MNRPTFLLLGLTALLLGGIIAHRQIAEQREQIATQRTEVAQRSAEVQRNRLRLAATKTEVDAEERATAARRAELAAFESSPAKLWADRIQVLKDLLPELPAQRIPELALLEVLDWIEIARDSELDTPAAIRAALATLRAKARQKIAPLLQEALRRFTDDSGGELPADVHQLARFLSAPATVKMLERYHLARSGRLGANDEHVIIEQSDSDMILSVSLSSWNMTNGSKLLAAPGETEMDAMERAATAMGSALGAEGAEMMQQFTRGLRELVEKLGPQLEAALGGSFEDEMKRAMAGFRAARPGTTSTNLGEILPYLPNADKLVAAFRPVFAQIDFMHHHQGRPPADAAQLRPYLDKPFNAREAFRTMKVELSQDGEHGSINFSLGVK